MTFDYLNGTFSSHSSISSRSPPPCPDNARHPEKIEVSKISKHKKIYIQKTKTAFKIHNYLLTNLYYKTHENNYICDRLLKYTE